MATIFAFLYMGCTLANTTEPFLCGGDAALCQIILTTCYLLAVTKQLTVTRESRF